MWLIFGQATIANHSQHDPHGPDDLFRTNDLFRSINYHPLDISGHDGLDEQNIGLRILIWKLGKCG
jgi:hypothetical protein